MTGGRFYEVPSIGARRSAPAALRNRRPISEVLREWLPETGVVLEVASGSGEHVVYFAEQFPGLDWQPSDIHPDALASVSAWREECGLENVRLPIRIDASLSYWPIEQASAVPSIKMQSDSWDNQKTAEKGGFNVVLILNMVHISPWIAALGLLDGAARVL